MRMHGRVVDASRQTIEAGIAALEGRTAEAVSLYAEAARQLRDLGLPLLVALGDLDLLATLGPGAARVAAEQEARDIVAKLGATALLPRLDALGFSFLVQFLRRRHVASHRWSDNHLIPAKQLARASCRRRTAIAPATVGRVRRLDRART